jgi:hypothetical protein
MVQNNIAQYAARLLDSYSLWLFIIESIQSLHLRQDASSETTYHNPCTQRRKPLPSLPISLTSQMRQTWPLYCS